MLDSNTIRSIQKSGFSRRTGAGIPIFEPRKKFPMVGKTAQKVSNGWKNRAKSFQWLEKPRKKFPMVGKTA
ncbi:MAG: hypothetical protein EOM20_19190 [Spartobacteria bacterium]|nr:hypothetical protein [Spartobacteria bacterium]